MREFRRQVTTLGVTYGTTVDQLEAFVEGIRAILRANPKVRQDAFEVHFRNFGASSLEVFLYFFLKVDTWSDELAQRQNLFLEIIRLAEELNIEFAFPTQTLHIESMAAQSAFTKQPVPSREEMLASIMAHAPEGERSVPHGRPYTDHGFRPGTAIARSDFDDDHG